MVGFGTHELAGRGAQGLTRRAWMLGCVPSSKLQASQATIVYYRHSSQFAGFCSRSDVKIAATSKEMVLV